MAFLARVLVVVVLEVLVRLEIRVEVRGVEHREKGFDGVADALA